MKKTIAFISIMVLSASLGFGQNSKYFTKTGHIYFISHTDIIDIDADNYQVGSILDIESGELVFSLLMKSFEFTLPLAEEHFNENYVESHKYPKSTFKGTILDIDKIDFARQDTLQVEVSGDLTIHGVTRTIRVPGELEIREEEILARSEFSVKLEDYKIKVPRIVDDKVAKVIPIKIEIVYLPYN